MVPVVSVGLGPVSGIGAMLMVESHFSVMVKEKSQVFVGGPPLVKWAMGQELTKEELGGYKIHTRLNGVVDNEAENEADAFEQTRQFLDYMPSNVRRTISTLRISSIREKRDGFCATGWRWFIQLR